MATFVLIPGAGGHAAYWNRLVPELETRGHRAIAVDIKENDPAMDLHGFAAFVEAAMGNDADVILVAQSLGGFTASMVPEPPSVPASAPGYRNCYRNQQLERHGGRPGTKQQAAGSPRPAGEPFVRELIWPSAGKRLPMTANAIATKGQNRAEIVLLVKKSREGSGRGRLRCRSSAERNSRP